MKDRDLRKKMTLANHLVEGLEPETASRIKECLVEEYIKDKTQLKRAMFDKIQSFLHMRSWIDLQSSIKESEEKELEPFCAIITQYDPTMIWMDNGTELEPLYIRYRELADIESMPCEDKTYKSFLKYIYSRVVFIHEPEERYSMSKKTWNQIKRLYGSYLKILRADEREFYSEVGYIEATRKIRSIKKKNNNALEKLSDQEKEKKIAFQTEDWRWIEIID